MTRARVTAAMATSGIKDDDDGKATPDLFLSIE